MNNNIVPQGTTEVINDGAIVTKKVLMLKALTDLVLTNVVFQWPATPANANVQDAFTLPAGNWLGYLAGFELTTGIAHVIYQDQ